MSKTFTRRSFLETSGIAAAATLLSQTVPSLCSADTGASYKAPVSAHLWVYASAHPPKWDSTSDLERVFSDVKSAGYEGVEIMDINLKHDDAVEHFGRLIKKYDLPVTGSSFGAPMWDKSKHAEILADVTLVIDRLRELRGKTFGISVGDAKRVKTGAELDAQADVLREVLRLCTEARLEANLHNHTYEIVNDMHDLKETLARIPDVKLGPDFNWLVRAGEDPVHFINTFGQHITYCHIRDQYANGVWTEYLGQGTTNYQAIAAALKASNFRGRAAVELAFPDKFVPANPLAEDWKRSRVYVRETFGW